VLCILLRVHRHTVHIVVGDWVQTRSVSYYLLCLSRTEYYMRTTFENPVRTQSVLESSVVSIQSPSCLRLSYYSLSREYSMTIITSLLSNVSQTFPLFYGVKHLFMNLSLGVFSIQFQVYKVARVSSDPLNPAMSDEVRIYEIDVIPRWCPVIGRFSELLTCYNYYEGTFDEI